MSLSPSPASSFFTISTAPLTINGQPLAGGFNASYDLGPSTAAISQSAYTFAQNAMAMQQGFLGQSIAGTQQFLSHQIAPLLQTANQQIQQNTSMLEPGSSYYQSLNGLVQNVTNLQGMLASEAITAQQAIASSSLQAASSAGGGGGGLFGFLGL